MELSQSYLDQAKIVTDFNALNHLRGAKADDINALKTTARQFEATFINMMLKQVRQANASLTENDFLSSQSIRFYEKLYDQQIASEVVSKRGFGLTDALVRQLSPSNIKNQVSEKTEQGLALNDYQDFPVNSNPKLVFDSSRDFIQTLLPYAKTAAEKLGVDPKILLAQAALETNWGKSIIKGSNGEQSHNLFGIKAGTSWEKERVVVPTLEFIDGIAKKIKAPFRRYQNFAESFNDYVNLISSTPRYEAALLKVKDPQAFTQALQSAGYATDPNYANKIQRIFYSDKLNKAWEQSR